MNFLSILTSLLFIGLMGFFAWRRFSQKDNFVRTYSLYSIRTILSYIFFCFALISIVLANLGITIFQTDSNTVTHSANIIFTIDVSKSMDAADISDGADSISRLETAKKFMIDYISKYPENRYGIILFAGKSLISSPLTIDTEVLTNIISSLDSKSIREGGTNLEDALALSIARFSDTKDPKTVVILSDGGETDDISSWENINAIIQKGKNISYAIFGFGRDAGAKIPLGQDVFGNILYKTQDGREIITKLGRENLERLGTITSTKPAYISSVDDSSELENTLNNTLHKNYLRTIHSQDDSSTRILLFASSIFLLASMFIIQTKK